MTGDDQRNEAVRRRLQAERPLPANSPADWDRLTQRIVAEAEPLLAARSANPARRTSLRAFSRIGIPLALAAGIATLVLLSRLEGTTSNTTAASAFLAALAGETSQESVLDATLGQPGETWLLAEGR